MPTLATSGITAAIPNVSAIPKMPGIAGLARMPDIPDIAFISNATQLNSRQSPTNVTLVAPTLDVGQDVRDRAIAHVVTGGMSGGRWS